MLRGSGSSEPHRLFAVTLLGRERCWCVNNSLLEAKQTGGSATPASFSSPPACSTSKARAAELLAQALPAPPALRVSFKGPFSIFFPFSLCFLWLEPVHKWGNVSYTGPGHVHALLHPEKHTFLNPCTFPHANALFLHGWVAVQQGIPVCAGLGKPFPRPGGKLGVTGVNVHWDHTRVNVHGQDADWDNTYEYLWPGYKWDHTCECPWAGCK